MDDELIISFYGDDFTGSTDVMESLSLNGIPAALFLQAPEPGDIQNFRLKNNAVSEDGKLKAFGVAGISRSLKPAEMDEELPSLFEKISRVPSRYFHYKICSTFDSSPETGNIGHAVEIALRYFPSSFIPLIVGIPFLNRFCVFGNLFARVEDITYRIDRHPTMSKHPVTPMHEADLRVHLGLQTNQNIDLIDVTQLKDEKTRSKRYAEVSKKGGYILFDVLLTSDLRLIGKVIEEGHRSSPQLLVGSSGVEYALAHYLQEAGKIKSSAIPTSTKRASHYMIVAGSCSPTTAQQIEHGKNIGYHAIRVDTLGLLENAQLEIERCTAACLDVLRNGGVPILLSAMGPDDPCITRTRDAYSARGKTNDNLGPLLARSQGKILKNVIDNFGKLRVTVAGGDTSGFVSQTLGISALEVLIPIAPGAPLCMVHASDSRYDGMEISLKGGQNGNSRYFESVHLGKAM